MSRQKIRKAYKAWRRSWSPLLPGRGAAFAAGAKWALERHKCREKAHAS